MIKVNTNGYGGKPLHKTARVLTNDPQRQVTQLTISGSVKVFANISPQKVKLYGAVDSELKETVRIVPEENYPFKIIDTKAQVGKDIRYKVSEDNHSRNLSYLLTVENLKRTTGRFYDTIYLMTDSSIKPKISIRVYGKISEINNPKPN